MHVVLETERLILRRFTADDVDNLVELDGDPEVVFRITGGVTTPREEVETDFLPAFLPTTTVATPTGSGPRSNVRPATSSGGSTSGPARGIPTTSRSWATGCGSRRGARAMPPKGPER